MQPTLFQPDASGVSPELAEAVSTSALLTPNFDVAISLTQPWASLVVLGEKLNETRSWSTKRRGGILIHASKGFPTWARDICGEEPFASVLAKHGLTVKTLPLGAIVGGVQLTGCFSTNDAAAMKRHVISKQERAFGNYDGGRFGLVLTDAFALPDPIVCPGMLSLWSVPLAIQQAVRAAREESNRNLAADLLMASPSCTADLPQSARVAALAKATREIVGLKAVAAYLEGRYKGGYTRLLIVPSAKKSKDGAWIMDLITESPSKSQQSKWGHRMQESLANLQDAIRERGQYALCLGGMPLSPGEYTEAELAEGIALACDLNLLLDEPETAAGEIS